MQAKTTCLTFQAALMGPTRTRHLIHTSNWVLLRAGPLAIARYILLPKGYQVYREKRYQDQVRYLVISCGFPPLYRQSHLLLH